MTHEEIVLQTKLTALNKLRDIFHPDYKGLSNNSWDDSYAEQRDYKARQVAEKLEKDLDALKLKKKARLGAQPDSK